MPLYFVENQGRLDPQVVFFVQGSDKTTYAGPSSVSLLLPALAATSSEDVARARRDGSLRSQQLDSEFTGAANFALMPAIAEEPVDMQVSKQVIGSVGGPGGAFAYRIDVANRGSGFSVATGVLLTDTLPPGTTYLSSTMTYCNPGFCEPGPSPSLAGNDLVWSLGSVFGDEWRGIDLYVRVADCVLPGTVVTNVVVVSSLEVDVQPGDNVAVAVATVSDVAPTPVCVYLPLVMRNFVVYYEGPWETEPNNTYLQANGPIRSGRVYYGYPNDDRDYWSFYAARPGAIHIDLTNDTGQGVQLQLFYQSTAGGPVAYVTSAPYDLDYSGPAGWYYVYIYAAGGYNQTTPYTLRVSYP
jgi:uncharacterized repeat protein (TIGR01451 family)